MANLVPLSGLAVINYVSENSASELAELLGSAGCQIFELDGTTVNDKSSFFGAVSSQLLANTKSKVESWAAFSDNWRSKVLQAESGFTALIWHEASNMLDGGLADLVTAIDVCTQIARELYAKERVFVVFLVGEGNNFPPLKNRFRINS